VDGNSIENYKYQISGRKLTIEVEEGVEFQVFMKKDGSFLTSFTSSKRWQFTLPGNFDEGRTYIPEPTKTESKSKSNSILYIVIAVLLIVVLILLFRQCRKESNTTEKASDNATSVANASVNTAENEVDKIISDDESLKKLDSIKIEPIKPYPYSKIEIIDFLSNYYQMINRGDAYNFEYFFEPIIEQFFRVSNMSSIAAKKNYEDNNLKKVSSYITYDSNDIIVNISSESAFVSVPAKIVVTKISDNSVKNYDIIHYFKISKNLKIKSLTEKIQKRY
jgi:hypothetical protein